MMSVKYMSKYIFTWRIKNYSSCCQTKEECVNSPEFDTGNLCGGQCYLRFYPTGEDHLEEDENFIAVYLTMWESKDEIIESEVVNFIIELVNEYGYVFISRESGPREFKSQSCWGFDRFMEVSELVNEMNSWTDDVLTIRCRINDVKLREKETVYESAACTTIGVDRSVVELDVQIPFTFEYFKSITFSIKNLHQFEMTVDASPTLKTIMSLIEIKEKLAQKITFKMTIFDKIGCRLTSKRSVYLFESEDEMVLFPSLLTKEELKVLKSESANYEFKLKCDAYIPNGNISNEYIEHFKITSHLELESEPKVDPTSELHNEFRSLFISKKYSDVIIRSENEEFHAHKLVLRIRSPVFAAMFDQDMLENQTGIVDITDMNGETLNVFLEFLYTETVKEMDYDIAKKLILAADKYQIPSLVNKCASFLKSSVLLENVCEVIEIADMINCERLKMYALNFIKINAAKILPTDAWSKWIERNVSLATYILSNLSRIIGTEYY